MKVRESRPASFWPLAIVFALFVLFMYGPMFVIFILSFQGPEGGLTFPMRGVSLHWFSSWPKGWAWWTLARRCGARWAWGWR